jgi:thioredoxin-like negative regulator of GroEL
MKVSHPDYASVRENALSRHKSGDLAEAARLYAILLKDDPTNADILGLMGMAQYRLGNRDAAKNAWLTSLSQQAASPIMLRNMNNFFTALLQEGTAAELPLVSEFPIPDWPAGLDPSKSEKDMFVSLARGLLHVGRKSDATKLLESVVPHLVDDAVVMGSAAEIMLAAGHADRADLLLQPLTAAAGRAEGSLLITHAAVAFAAGKREEALALSARAVEAIPVCITLKSANQTMLVGVLNKAPGLIRNAVTPAGFHFSENSPASLAKNFNDEYRFLSVFPEASTARPALETLPRPDIFLNNWVNAESLSTPSTLQFISNFADSLGLPILNHPRKAAETTRQRNAERLTGIPNLVVPRVVRFINSAGNRKAVIRLIRNAVGFPAIIRNPFMQMGREAAKLDTPRQLEKHLNQIPDQELYAIEYVHNPIAENIYRKIRAAVIGEDIFISHVHFSQQWNVHREKDEEKRAAFNLEPATVEYGDKIISDPLGTLGKPGMAALKEIRTRIPLEFFGIDFDIMADGRLLFFEANAAMNISMIERKGREATRAGMRDALRHLFQKAIVR